VCCYLAELEMDEFDICANAYCDCEELTDLKFDRLANKFCDILKN